VSLVAEDQVETFISKICSSYPPYRDLCQDVLQDIVFVTRPSIGACGECECIGMCLLMADFCWQSLNLPPDESALTLALEVPVRIGRLVFWSIIDGIREAVQPYLRGIAIKQFCCEYLLPTVQRWHKDADPDYARSGHIAHDEA
jgi:hypothetical protein